MKNYHTNDGLSNSFTEPTPEAVGQFMRTKAVGLVKVVNLTPYIDLYALYPYAPAAVRDLQYIAMSYDDIWSSTSSLADNVSLNWVKTN